jgi:hypothetical protein
LKLGCSTREEQKIERAFRLAFLQDLSVKRSASALLDQQFSCSSHFFKGDVSDATLACQHNAA